MIYNIKNNSKSVDYYSSNTDYYMKEAKKTGKIIFSSIFSFKMLYISIFFIILFVSLIALALPHRGRTDLIWIAPWYIWLIVSFLAFITNIIFWGYEYKFIADFKRGLLIKDISLLSHRRGQKIVELDKIKLIGVTSYTYKENTKENGIKTRLKAEVIALWVNSNNKIKKTIIESVDVDDNVALSINTNSRAEALAKLINAEFIPFGSCSKINIIKNTIDNNDINTAIKKI